MGIVQGGWRMASVPLVFGVLTGIFANLDLFGFIPGIDLLGFYTEVLPIFIYWILCIALLALTAFILISFRDPKRLIGKGIVSPADGTVKFVRHTGGKLHVSIYLGALNVHVVRAPIYGTVKRMIHRKGAHHLAYKPESEDNERWVLTMNTPSGEVGVAMITGGFARRIMPYMKSGEMLKKGEKIGFIRFGSRVDILLPATFESNVVPGSKVRAAVDTIAVESKYPGKDSNFGDAWVISGKR
jgi:phosphatidylserine decarboxylase